MAGGGGSQIVDTAAGITITSSHVEPIPSALVQGMAADISTAGDHGASGEQTTHVGVYSSVLFNHLYCFIVYAYSINLLVFSMVRGLIHDYMIRHTDHQANTFEVQLGDHGE